MRVTMRAICRRVFICVAFFFCVSCMRVFLPRSIRSTDVFHLARLVVQWQNFPVDQADDTFFGNDSIPVRVSLPKVEQYLKTWSSKIDFADKNVTEEFKQPMSISERQQMLVTLETFVQACQLTNLTYFVIGGTMLGAYRHHGFIPWDDDIDVVMDASEWRKIRHVLSHVPGYDVFISDGNQWKFFNKDLPFQGDSKFKWPNIDIFFYTGDDTYIWGLTAGIKDELFSTKSDFFPLQSRQFEHMNVSVPRNFEELVLKEYDTNLCVTRSYCHKTNRLLETKSRQCKDFHSIYPFVFRSTRPDGSVVETLKVGERTIRNITVPTHLRLR